MKEQYGKWQVYRDHGLKKIRTLVVQHVDDPDMLGAVTVRGTRNGKPDEGFINRIESLKGLDHPNVLKLIDYDLQAERPYMVTELCRGGTLREADLSSWTVQEKIMCSSQINAGYTYLWEKGLAKSDHNFKNVFLKEDGRTPVLGDFELARPIEKNAKGVHTILEQASRMFWELMEEKSWNQVLGEELRKSHRC